VPTEVLVLCYHGVSDTWPADISLTPARFEAQLRALLDRGYEGATLVDALTAPSSTRVVVVTFDDAYQRSLAAARPILQRLGMPATVFVPTDHVGNGQPMTWAGNEAWAGTRYEDELHCASWSELRELADLGWEIGSHTCSHPRLTRVDDRRLANELADSRAACERELERPCVSLAYPHSDEDDRVVRAARRAGYSLGVTVPESWQAPLPLRWPRMQVGTKDVPWRLRARVAQRRSPVVYATGSRAVRWSRRLTARASS
jgi:peptidoglycan/xylan/chitin deacetylase (PgdA/CDA1 family)